MPKYELKGVYIKSFGTNGAHSSDDEFDFVTEDTQGETYENISMSFTEIEIRYTPNDAKTRDALPTEELTLNYEVVKGDPPVDAFDFVTQDATPDNTPHGFEWIEIKAPPKPQDGTTWEDTAAQDYDLMQADMQDPMPEDVFMM